MSSLKFSGDPDAGRLHIERLSVRKSWVKEYEKRVCDLAIIRDENYVPPERKSLALSISKGSIIAKNLGKHIKRRLRDKKYTCRRTIDNLAFPKHAQKWNSIMGTQLICDICGLSGLFDCTSCQTCNAIAHRLCVGQLYGRLDDATNLSFFKSSTDKLNSKGSSLGELSEEDLEADDDEDQGSGSDDDKFGNVIGGSVTSGSLQSSSAALSYSVAVGRDMFVCGSCRLNEAEDQDYYDRLYVKLQGERRYVLACRVVARRILAYIERCRFKKLKRGLILIQSVIRKRRAKRWLFYLRRNLIRVVILDIQDMPSEVRPTDIICITVVDPMKHGQQFFRFDKTAELARQEGFFIAGISAMMTIVVTILRVEEHTAGTSYIMLQQAQLAVRDGDYNERRSYNMLLSKVITWVPQDPRGDYPGYHLRNPPDRSKGDKMDGDKPWLRQDIIVMSDVYQSQMHEKDEQKIMHEELAYKEAVAKQRHLEDLGLSPKKEIPMPAHMLEALDSKTSAAAKQRSAEERYWNQFTEMSGPPLEELRKPPETDLRLLNKKSSLDSNAEVKLKTMVEGRTSLWWLSLCYLRLYFFQYHGDIRPRLVADVTDAVVEVSSEYANKCVVKIVMSDKRTWLIEFEDFKKAQHFEFAIRESQEGFRAVGGSIFINTKDVRSKRRDFGHNQPIF